MIKIEELSKAYKKIKALQDINVSFEKGQSIAIIGPNESGKTTLIKCILGMVKPDQGTIQFKDQDIRAGRDYLKNIGYMPQIGRYPDRMRVGEVFQLMKALRKTKDQPQIDETLLKAFQLETLFNKPMYSLSGGTRQKVSASLAFLFSPQVLMLDEPTAGLDPLSSEILKNHIKAKQEEGKLILITSHILSDLEEICDYLLYLQEGHIKLFLPIAQIKAMTEERLLTKAITKMLKNNLSEWEKSSLIYSMT